MSKRRKLGGKPGRDERLSEESSTADDISTFPTRVAGTMRHARQMDVDACAQMLLARDGTSKGPGHGRDAVHRMLVFSEDKWAELERICTIIADALMGNAPDDEKVGMEVCARKGGLAWMAVIGDQKGLEEAGQELGMAYPDGSVHLSPEVIACPFREVVPDEIGQVREERVPGPGPKLTEEPGPLNGRLPAPVQEVVTLLNDEATRRGFRLMVAFIRDDGDMKVHHAVNGEVMFDRRQVPIPRPNDPGVDARALADLVRREAAKRGLTFLFLSMEEGDGGTGGNTPEHAFGDPESLKNYLQEAEKAEGHPLVTVDYSRLQSWTEGEGG
jgi:hypothetical protein